MRNGGTDHLYTKIDRRIWSSFDWPILVFTLILCGVGALNLYSATFIERSGLFTNQMVSMVIGFGALLLVFMIPYRYYEASTYWIFAVTLILLVLVLLMGKSAHGARRWLAMGPISFQPSELMKISLAMALARYFSVNKNYEGYTLRELLVPLVITMIPVTLIALQPDLGTAVMHLLIFASIALYMRIRRRSLVMLVTLAIVSIPLGWLYVLQDYQKARILTLINPGRDPLGAGYHIRQSIIAVGSGKISGKPFLKGTQTKLQFLPEHHTDFIFSVFAEEWGFIGCLVLLSLYFLLIVAALSVSLRSKDRYGSILAVALTAIVFWHVVVNVFMVIGLAPVVGVTLPFMSYGRTSLVTMLITVGLLLNISSRRFMFESY